MLRASLFMTWAWCLTLGLSALSGTAAAETISLERVSHIHSIAVDPG
jgi:hypothetical protein